MGCSTLAEPARSRGYLAQPTSSLLTPDNWPAGRNRRLFSHITPSRGWCDPNPSNIATLGINGEDILGTLTNNIPLPMDDCLIGFIEETFNVPLESLAGHYGEMVRRSVRLVHDVT